MMKLHKKSTLMNWTRRELVDLAGFEIVGRVTLKHKKTGKIFK